MKKRWITLASVLGAAGYILNNYHIHGLDGLRLEPRNASTASGAGMPGWPSPIPNGPTLGMPTGYSNGGTNPYVQPFPQTSNPVANPAVGPSTSFPSTFPSTASANTPAASSQSLTDRILTPLGIQNLNPFGTASNAAGSNGLVPAPKGLTVDTSAGAANVTPLRIASFNVADLDSMKRDRPIVKQVLVRILSQFDVVAIQRIRSQQDDVLPDLVAAINAGGKRYDFLIGPRVGRGQQREQYAFIFDTDRIETDRFQLYTVDDPEDLIHFEPLVGWFRAKNVPPQSAFTFSLVSLRLDPNFVTQEVAILPDLMRSIAADGRGEDDIIVAGDFGLDVAQSLAKPELGLRVALNGIATTTRGTQALDNFVFSQTATTEYTGRSGSYDFLRHLNLSLEQSLEVSDHLPAWVEFLPIEGGRPGQVAARTMPTKKLD